MWVDIKQKLFFFRDVKVIPWELQHRLVVVELDKNVLERIVRKEQILKFNVNQTRVRFEKVKKLVSIDASDLLKTFNEVVLKACDEVCEKKKSRRDRGAM